jgi:putative aldouronate transport system permease protein
MVRKTREDLLFTAVNYTLMTVLSFFTLYPFLFLVVSSLSVWTPPWAASPSGPGPRRRITICGFWPTPWWPRYYNTILRTMLGTSLSLLATFTLAYPLSKKTFPLRNLWTALVVFTMFFSGGLIPTYLLVKNLGLVDTVWSLVLPELVSAYNLVIVRNYMQTIPASLEESAKSTGPTTSSSCSGSSCRLQAHHRDHRPVGAVWHWNAWFDCMIYVTKAGGGSCSW